MITLKDLFTRELQIHDHAHINPNKQSFLQEKIDF